MDASIRPAVSADAASMGLVTVAASLSAFVGVLPEAMIDFGWTPEASAAGWLRTLEGRLEPSEFVSVAEVDGDVVGFVWAGAESDRADYTHLVSGLYVLPTLHGRGIGRQLFVHAADRCAGTGIDSLLVGCIKENPACGFYEHLGGVEVYRRQQRVDRFDTEEVFFGWPSTVELRSSVEAEPG